MAEFLIRTHYKMTADALTNAGAHQRGDVIVAMPDGHDWRPGELTHAEWRIIKFPNISMEKAEAWISPELPPQPVIEGATPKRYLQRRGFRLDLDSFPEDLQYWLADDTRKSPAISLEWDFKKLQSLTGRVAPIADPYVLGG